MHASGSIPKSQGYIEIEIPAGVDIETWDAPSFEAGRRFGDQWYDERRTAVLIVPSVVTLVEPNVLINQEPPAFTRIRPSEPRRVRWGARLRTRE